MEEDFVCGSMISRQCLMTFRARHMSLLAAMYGMDKFDSLRVNFIILRLTYRVWDTNTEKEYISFSYLKHHAHACINILSLIYVCFSKLL